MFKLISEPTLREKITAFKENGLTHDTVVSIDKDGNPISYFGDNSWDYNAFNDGNLKKSELTIKFHAEKHNPRILHDLKERCYYLLWREGELLEGGKKFRAFSQLQRICENNERTLRVFKNTPINHIAQLSSEIVFGLWKEGVQGKSAETIEKYLEALKALEQVNDCLEPNHHLALPPFQRNKLAKKLCGSAKGNFPVVIPQIYDPLLKRLIDDVESASDEINQLDDVRAYALNNNVTERQAVEHFKCIEGSCFMTLTAFAGMRVSELVTVTSDSYYVIDVDGIEMPALSLKTIKLEKGIKREDIWACAPICKKTLKVLTKLWSKDRDDPTNIRQRPKFIFDGRYGAGVNIKSHKGCLKLIRNELSRIFSEHSERLNFIYDPETMDEAYKLLNPRVNPAKDPRVKQRDGSIYWRMSTHSLRRSFAHFCYGHGVVSLGALKQQFKHVSITMTAIYSEHADVLALLGIKQDKVLQKELQRNEMDYHKTYVDDLIKHPESQSGGFKPKVFKAEDYETFVKDTAIANSSTGYGRCFAGDKCSMNHIFEPSGCVVKDCENLNINTEEALRWKARHMRLSDSITKMMMSGFVNRHTLGREISDLRAAEKVMRNHHIEFIRFEVSTL